MSGRAPTAALLLALLGACGVKAPPRASGAPDKEAPNELFRPAEDPDTHRAAFVQPDDQPVQPAAPPATGPAR